MKIFGIKIKVHLTTQLISSLKNKKSKELLRAIYTSYFPLVLLMARC